MLFICSTILFSPAARFLLIGSPALIPISVFRLVSIGILDVVSMFLAAIRSELKRTGVDNPILVLSDAEVPINSVAVSVAVLTELISPIAPPLLKPTPLFTSPSKPMAPEDEEPEELLPPTVLNIVVSELTDPLIVLSGKSEDSRVRPDPPLVDVSTNVSVLTISVPGRSMNPFDP